MKKVAPVFEKEEKIIVEKEKLHPHVAWCLFDGGIEKAFTGNMHEFEGIGTYHCAGCDSELFRYFQKN